LCYEVARLESLKINSLSSLKFVFCHGDLPRDIASNLYNKIHNSMNFKNKKSHEIFASYICINFDFTFDQ